MEQKKMHGVKHRDAHAPPDLKHKSDDDCFPLTSSERLIIRNYRTMKRSVQQTFVDISEELALALPAARPTGVPAPVQNR